MRLKSVFLVLVILILCVPSSLLEVGQAAPSSAARFGYYWQDRSLYYDTEFSYFFDVSVYPAGIFADQDLHSWAYVTAQNKHIVYGGVPYSVEVVLQYGYYTDNASSIKRVWMNDYDDPTRFINPWIDSDADGIDYWDLSTLKQGGYLHYAEDMDGDLLLFLRVQAQTIFISESTMPVESTWQNRFYFYNFSMQRWDLKVQNSFTIPASRDAVREATYQTGSGIWAAILETESDGAGGPDNGKPPVRKIVYQNRWLRVIDQGSTSYPDLNADNQNWIAPAAPYALFFRSQPDFLTFGAGSKSGGLILTYLPFTLHPSH